MRDLILLFVHLLTRLIRLASRRRTFRYRRIHFVQADTRWEDSGHARRIRSWTQTIQLAAWLACPSEDVVFVADMNNWRVQKLILNPKTGSEPIDQLRGVTGSGASRFEDREPATLMRPARITLRPARSVPATPAAVSTNSPSNLFSSETRFVRLHRNPNPLGIWSEDEESVFLERSVYPCPERPAGGRPNPGRH